MSRVQVMKTLSVNPFNFVQINEKHFYIPPNSYRSLQYEFFPNFALTLTLLHKGPLSHSWKACDHHMPKI